MDLLSSLATSLRQAGIELGEGMGLAEAVRLGWDYWKPEAVTNNRQRSVDLNTDGRGMARVCHRHLLHDEVLPDGTRPILSLEMDVARLVAGFWRQCLIRPYPDDERSDPDPYFLADPTRLCITSDHLIALVGHAPRDLALWLIELRRRDRVLFKHVLAKDFRTALRMAPEIIAQPWPTAVTRIWNDDEGDFLPPFLVAVLYAEIARLAINQAGLLRRAFDGKIEMTSRRLLDRVAASGGDTPCEPADGAIADAPLQSFALIPPMSLRESGDTAALKDWLVDAVPVLLRNIHQSGVPNLTAQTPSDAKLLASDMAAHPQYLPEARKEHGSSMQFRYSGTFWGLDWRMNAAIGLLEIADAARRWNKTHRPQGRRLPSATDYRHPSSVARAIAAIRFRWLVEQNRPAGLIIFGEILSKRRKAEIDFGRWTVDQIGPLTLDDFLGDGSGLDMLKRARKEMRSMPKPGEFGYTARSHPNLWLDEEGDDLAHYRYFQSVVENKQNSIPELSAERFNRSSGTPQNVIDLMANTHGIETRRRAGPLRVPEHFDTTSVTDLNPSKGAQILGQTISPLSTDPIHARLQR